MRNVLLIGVALSLLSFGCGGDEKKDCNDGTDRDLMAADVSEDNAKECYLKCVKTDMSETDCKKACYSDWTKEDKCTTCFDKCVKEDKNPANCKIECCAKESKDVDAGSTDTTSVDASSDVTGTDAVNVPEDVTPQG